MFVLKGLSILWISIIGKELKVLDNSYSLVKESIKLQHYSQNWQFLIQRSIHSVRYLSRQILSNTFSIESCQRFMKMCVEQGTWVIAPVAGLDRAIIWMQYCLAVSRSPTMPKNRCFIDYLPLELPIKVFNNFGNKQGQKSFIYNNRQHSIKH